MSCDMDLSFAFQIKACNVCKPFERCGVHWWCHVSRVHYSLWLTELGLSCGTKCPEPAESGRLLQKGSGCEKGNGLFMKKVFRVNHTLKILRHAQ